MVRKNMYGERAAYMKKWIITRKVTGIVLLLFALSIVLVGRNFALEEAAYSELSSVKLFVMSVVVMLGWWGAPMLAVFGLFIISVIRIKEFKNQKDRFI